MPTPIAPSATSKASTGLESLDVVARSRFAVFQHIDFPADLTVSGLMAWLGNRMTDSDEGIRAKMAGINGRKTQQAALNEMLEALRSSRLRNADAGGGCLKLDAPLDDPEAIRASDFYKSLNPKDRGPLDALLDKMKPPVWQFTSKDPGSGKMVTITFSDEDAKKYGWKDGVDGAVRVPASLGKDAFEDAIQGLGNMSKQLTSSDEMDMIQLQSAISARGQLLQMVSNIQASFNSTGEKIVGNMR